MLAHKVYSLATTLKRSRRSSQLTGGLKMMQMRWEDLTTVDEKVEYLRAQLKMLGAEIASDQRRLNDRITKLEESARVKDHEQ